MAEAESYQGYAAALIGGRYLSLGDAVTTAPTTNLNKGYMFLAFGTSTPQIGVCTSGAANTIKYFTADTSTFGRTTA